MIHQVAQDAVLKHSEGKTATREEIVNQAVALFRDGVNASRRGTKLDNQWIVLLEHVYPNDPPSVPGDNPEQAAEQIVRERANTFFDSEGWQLIQRHPPEHVAEADESFQSFQLDGVPEMPGGVTVFAIPDVLLHDGERITIIDWKTGGVDYESIRQQAGVYLLYAHLTYGLPEEAIDVRIADLGATGALVDPPGGTPSLAEAETFVRGSIAHMFASMQSIEYNTVAIQDFPQTSDLHECQSCGFKRACWRHSGAGNS